MKKLKLNLDRLSEEMELLDVDYLKGIKGGYGGDGGYGGYRGYGDPDNPIELPEVVVEYGGNGTGGNTFPPGYVPPYNPGGYSNYLPGGESSNPGGYGQNNTQTVSAQDAVPTPSVTD